MKNIFTKGHLAIITVLGFVTIDQIVKIVVKMNMVYGEAIRITNWFYINFTENSGMAFGIQLMPKVIQTIARIIFAILIGWYIIKLIKANYKYGYIIVISSILAGAIGNILDSIIYGTIFTQSTYSEISTLVPVGNGYADWLYGKVVDMFYFPLFEFNWPEWFPFKGGEEFIFFGPVFNFADAVICCGTFMLIFFYKNTLNDSMSLIIPNWGKK